MEAVDAALSKSTELGVVANGLPIKSKYATTHVNAATSIQGNFVPPPDDSFGGGSRRDWTRSFSDVFAAVGSDISEFVPAERNDASRVSVSE